MLRKKKSWLHRLWNLRKKFRRRRSRVQRLIDHLNDILG
jgi:hypothetical protein